MFIHFRAVYTFFLMKDKDSIDMLLTEKRLKTFKKWPYDDDVWMSVWIGMTGGMDKHWGEKELPRVGHQLASCSLLISYVLMFLVVIPGYSWGIL